MESATARGLYWVIGQFTLIIIIALAAVFDPFKSTPSLAFSVVGISCVILGIVCLVLAFQQLGASLTAYPKPLATGTLVTHGLYSIVRHPIYTGLLLGCVGVSLAAQSPVAGAVSVVLAIWLNFKANFEESWLMTRYTDYATYRTHTKKFIPFIW